MIDRKRRDALGELLRQFIDGLITNAQFEEQLDVILDDPRPVRKWDDPALWAIRTKAWYLYDDLRVHRLKDRWAITPEGRSEIARWILFLHSDCSYEWPVKNFINHWGCLLTVLTLGLARLILPRLLRRRYDAMGDWSVWPFIRRSDYKEALKHPRLLAGSSGGQQH